VPQPSCSVNLAPARHWPLNSAYCSRQASRRAKSLHICDYFFSPVQHDGPANGHITGQGMGGCARRCQRLFGRHLFKFFTSRGHRVPVLHRPFEPLPQIRQLAAKKFLCEIDLLDCHGGQHKQAEQNENQTCLPLLWPQPSQKCPYFSLADPISIAVVSRDSENLANEGTMNLVQGKSLQKSPGTRQVSELPWSSALR